MKLATLRDGTRDGRLHVVRADGKKMAPAPAPWITLQAALDQWEKAEPSLRNLAAGLDSHPGLIDVDVTKLAAPLPRAYEWVDGSAYLNHVRLVRKARNAEPPATLETDPLVYQGGSSEMLGPRDPMRLVNEAWGLDFEAEVCVVLGDVPLGTTAAEASKHVRLLMICNDVTLRNMIPEELAKGFGFFQSKPATAFAPFAITPDELGAAWKNGRAHIVMRCIYNGKEVGNCDAGPEMHFSFYDLIAHLAKTRAYTAGTIVGSGTISNADLAHGISCLAEQRMIETINNGKPATPFMKAGETIVIRAESAGGDAPWGTIEQIVTPVEGTSRLPVR